MAHSLSTQSQGLNVFKRKGLLQRLILSQIIVFVLFIALLIPFVHKIDPLLAKHILRLEVKGIKEQMERFTSEQTLEKGFASVDGAMFFHILVLDHNHNIVVDNRPDQDQSRVSGFDAAVGKALVKKSDYLIAKYAHHNLIYMFESFHLETIQTPYVLCAVLPYSPFEEMIKDASKAFMVSMLIVLILFNLLIARIVHSMTRPIQEVIRQMSQNSFSSVLAKLVLGKPDPTGSCEQLVDVHNHLIDTIQEQITSLRQAKEEKEGILASLDEGVIAFSETFDIQYVNQTALLMCHVRKVDQPFHQIAQELETSALFQEGVALIREARLQKKRMQRKIEEKGQYFDLVATPIFEERQAILVMQDKTEHYRALEMGKEFIANASHELRTPITIIQGYAALLDQVEKKGTALLIEIKEKIESACVRMSTLVHSLLLLASAESSVRSRFVPIDLSSLLLRVVELVQTAHPQVDIAIALPQEQIIVCGDEDLLSIACVNVIENGIKYSTHAAKIQIRLKKQAESALIEIQDSGKGIPEGDLPYIFKRFYRVDKSHSRKTGGAGLGLSIVQTIILKHQGKIKAFSKEGEGSTFTIELATYEKS